MFTYRNLFKTAVIIFFVFTNNFIMYSQSFEQQSKIVASDRNVADSFGRSVSISGNIILVGSNVEDQDEDGENTMNSAGSAYVFDYSYGDWSQSQKIVASDRAVYDEFGSSVSVSGDYLVVAAYKEDEDENGENTLDYSGSAYVFEKDDTGTWGQVQKIVASDRDADDYFGYSISISGDYILVGAYTEDDDENGSNAYNNAGSAYIFERDDSGKWSQAQKIVALDRAINDFFGYKVAICGNYAAISAAINSYVYIFEKDRFV